MSSRRENFEDMQLLELAKKYVEEAEKDAAANPATESIQVVVVEPMKKPYKKTIPNTLEAMNELVGGYIEIVQMGKTQTGASIAITLNEEGKLLGLPMNRRIVNFDILVGTFFITAFNMQGENVSLPDQECDKLIKRFAGIEVYI